MLSFQHRPNPCYGAADRQALHKVGPGPGPGHGPGPALVLALVLVLVLALVLVLVLVLPLVFPCAISEMHPLRPVWSSASAKQVAG